MATDELNPSPTKHEATYQPDHYSQRLASLFEFLEKEENKAQSLETSSIASHESRPKPNPSGNRSRIGLADITNHCSSPPPSASRTRSTGGRKAKAIVPDKDEEKLQNCSIDGALPTSITLSTCPLTPASLRSTSSTFQSPGSSLTRDKKKYIWDDWEETKDGDIVCIQDDDGEERSTDAGQCMESTIGCDDDIKEDPVIAARRQIQELNAMGEEIRNKVALMKSEMEEKSKLVEELHSLRVKNESDHVQKMKNLKTDWTKKIDDIKTKHNKVMAYFDFCSFAKCDKTWLTSPGIAYQDCF